MCLRMFCCCEEKDHCDEFEYVIVPTDDLDNNNKNKDKDKKIYRVVSYSCKKNGLRLHSNILTYKKAQERVIELNNQIPYIGWKRRPYYIVTVNHI